jgi:hypothetical protein
MKRGIVGTLNLYQWLEQIRNGDQSALQAVTVQLQSEDRTSVVHTWKAVACAHRQARERTVQRARQRHGYGANGPCVRATGKE